MKLYFLYTLKYMPTNEKQCKEMRGTEIESKLDYNIKS